MAANCSMNPIPSVCDTPKDQQTAVKPAKLRVLSFFDGIGTGLMVLDKLGFDVEAYFAFESDPNAIMVAKSNFGDRIRHLGRVEDGLLVYKETLLEMFGEINLVIGGFPCKDLLLGNPDARGLCDTRGTGHLFYYYYHIWNKLRTINKQLYWLYDNVGMEARYSENISQFLDRDYHCAFDSIDIDGQNRRRLIWSNIPYVEDLELELNGPASSNKDKSRRMVKRYAKNTPIKTFEAMLGIPPNYTKVANLSGAARKKLLRKTWSVFVTERIFEPLTKIFQLK